MAEFFSKYCGSQDTRISPKVVNGLILQEERCFTNVSRVFWSSVDRPRSFICSLLSAFSQNARHGFCIGGLLFNITLTGINSGTCELGSFDTDEIVALHGSVTEDVVIPTCKFMLTS